MRMGTRSRLAFAFCAAVSFLAPAASRGDAAAPAIRTGRPVRFAVSPPLAQLPAAAAPVRQAAAAVREIPLCAARDPAAALASADRDGALRPFAPLSAMPGPILTFEGLGNDAGVLPPDPAGDIGPNHYVEAVNLRFRVFDRTGAPLTPSLKISSLFAALGGPAATYDDGDPIVLYDPLADRWLISQFVISVTPCHEVIAISQTGDPTGAYYLYDFIMPGGNVNDYPHFGVWPDAYYMTDNQFTPSAFDWRGAGVFAFDRAKMLAGDPSATYIYFDLFAQNPGLGGLLPADLDGPPPPAGTPNYFACLTANEWGDPQDGLQLFAFRPDFATPSASTFTQSQFIAVAPFDPNFAGGRDNIPQPGTTEKLDAIADRLMYRLQYRYFPNGGYEALVVNHTVDESGTDHAGIRSYELRRALPAGAFYMHDQTTYAPDADHRWMGSSALDADGNLAVGFSVSGTSTFPSIRYVGRRSTDSGGFTLDEATMYPGAGSQTHSASRWGDYTMLTVDPVDDTTFWYINEYYPSTSSAGWHTRIGCFRFPGTLPAPQAAITGAVVDAESGLPISNATVRSASSGYSRATGGDGAYRMTVYPDTYTLAASAAGYLSSTGVPVSVANGGVGAARFALMRLAPDVTPDTPFVTSGPPGGPYSPTSKVYAVTNPGAGLVTWTATWASAWLSVDPAGGTLGPGQATAVVMRAAAGAGALPLGSHSDTVVFSNLVTGVAVAREAQLNVTLSHVFTLDDDPGWTRAGQWAFGPPLGSGGDPTSGRTGPNVFGYNLSGQYGNNISGTHWLTTPALNCAGLVQTRLRFWRWLGVESSSWDHAYVQVSPDGLAWTTVWQNSGSSIDDGAWYFQDLDIAAVADGKPAVYVRWGLGPTDGSVTYCGWNIDDIEVTGVFPEMGVAPTNGLAGSGYLYGPFAPDSASYTVSNGWTGPLAWTTICAAAWFAADPPGGTLALGETATARASFSPAAYALPPGAYRSVLVFSNMGSGYAVSVPVALTVRDVPALQFALDSDPGWPRQGEWAFGAPYGNGGAGGGHPDPAAGATGPSVFGVNLSGDYSTTPGGPFHLTAGPFDFRAYTNVALEFERWLNTDVQPFATATLELSTNGTDWATLWQNPLNPNAANHPNKPIPRTSPTADGSWSHLRYDIAAAADRQPAVYVRWGYQVGSYALAYSGWNIDDIVFTGGATGAALVVYPDAVAFSGDAGGPFASPADAFTVKNMGEDPLDWSASASNAWLTLSSSGGTLPAHGYTSVVASITAAANALPPGTHACDIVCSNRTAGTSFTRSVRLTAVAVPGVVSISDSVPPEGDRQVPFGDAFVGTAVRQRIAVTNSDPAHSLVVSNILFYRHYAEDFSDGAAQGWQEDIDADWAVTNGEYRAAAAGDGWMMAAYTGETWSNVFAEVSCRRTGPVGDAVAVVLRASPDFDPDGTGSAYVFEISQTSYGVWKQVNGTWAWLRIWATTTVVSNGVNTILATAIGTQLRLTVNGTLLWSGGDASIASGRVGLSGYRAAGDCVHFFDNFRAGDTRFAPEQFAIEGAPATPAVLAPGEGFAFDVLFAPNATGAHQNVVDIRSDDRTTPVAPVLLSGTGLPDHLVVTPVDRFDSAGHPGGPFAPSETVYTVSNRTGVACDWSAAADVAWLSVAPSTGALAASEWTTVTVAVSAAAAALPEGVESGAVSFSNTVTGSVQPRPARITVYRSPEVWLAPASLTLTQRLGYAQATGTFAVGNAGDDTLAAGITGSVAWLTLDATNVAVAAGTSAAVQATVRPDGLVPGTYAGSVAIQSNDRTDPLTNLAVHLTVLPNDLSVLPSGGLAGSGPEAGPFTPSGKVYSVDNTGLAPFDWSATPDDPSWLNVAPSSGTLDAGSGTAVRVSFSAAAYAMQPGVYSNRVVFSNSVSAYTATRDVALIVLAPGVGPGAIALFDSDAPATDRAMSFGRVTLGQSLTRHLAITNIDLTNSLVIGEITLSERYLEDFNDGLAQEWAEDLDGNWSVVNGEYRAASADTDFMSAVFLGGYWTNVAAEISVHRTGASTTSAGLALRASDDFDPDGVGSAYIFQLSGQGSFMVWKQVAGAQTLLQDWTSSTAIRTAGNYLAASAAGTTLRLFVNGTLVWQGTDSSLSAGRVGLTGYTSPTDQSVHFFDYVRIGGPLSWGVLAPEQALLNAQAAPGSNPALASDVPAGPAAAPNGLSPQEAPLVSLMPTNYALANVPALPLALGPGTGVTFDVIFQPGVRGVHPALVIVGSDDADEPRIPVTLTGTGTPATVTLTTGAGANGTITPSGTVVVAYDASPSFVVKGEPYYHVGAIATNGGAIPGSGGPAVTNWTWAHVTDDGTAYATFAENRTSRGTPEWWLAAHGLTNNAPAVEEATDLDEDGAPAWSEFFAGTDPAAGSSVLEIAELRLTNGVLILRWPSTTNAILLPYAVERAAALPPIGSWIRLGPDIGRTPPTNQWSIPGWSTNLNQHYRIIVPTNGW